MPQPRPQLLIPGPVASAGPLSFPPLEIPLMSESETAQAVVDPAPVDAPALPALAESVAAVGEVAPAVPASSLVAAVSEVAPAVPASSLVAELSEQLIESEAKVRALEERLAAPPAPSYDGPAVSARGILALARYAEALEGALFRVISDRSVADVLLSQSVNKGRVAEGAPVLAPLSIAPAYRSARSKFFASPLSAAAAVEFVASCS